MSGVVEMAPDCAGRNVAQLATATKFWTFIQNNSGGSFDFDEDAGITHYVIVEATSREHAINRATDAGIYFDGCASGMDCECCGDRWSEPWCDDASEFPEVYGHNVRADGGYVTRWSGDMPDGKEVCVHPIHGQLEWYGTLPDRATVQP